MSFEHNTNMSTQTKPSISVVEVSIFLLEKEKQNRKNPDSFKPDSKSMETFRLISRVWD